jgi:hypothetical protein
MKFSRPQLTAALLTLLAVVLTSTTVSTASAAELDLGQALMGWMKDHGGYVHPSLDIQPYATTGNADDSSTPFFHIVATQAIDKGDVLLDLPAELLVKPHDYIQVGDRVWTETIFQTEEHRPAQGHFLGTILAVYDDEETVDVLYDDGDTDHHLPWGQIMERELLCATVQRLEEEAELDDRSFFAPYMNYLLQQPHGQLPIAWSEPGQALLYQVVRSGGMDLPDLPPFLDFAGDEQVYLESCLGPEGKELDTPRQRNFFHLLNQRGWDEVMIPIFDMMSHGNGRLLNTEHTHVRHPPDADNDHQPPITRVQLMATQPIAAGEELYTTYTHCPDCENRFFGYGTPELLRDYGFVEAYPQRWFFDFEEFAPPVAFEVDLIEADEKTANYTFSWLANQRPNAMALDYFRHHLLRIQLLLKTTLAPEHKLDEIPDYEWNTVVQYAKTLDTALTVALQEAGAPELLANCNEEDSNECSLSAIATLYDDLVPPEEEIWVDDRPDTCNAGDDDENHPYHNDPVDILQTIQSPYQSIVFYANLKRNLDTCFMLDQGMYNTMYIVVFVSLRFFFLTMSIIHIFSIFLLLFLSLVTQICTSYRPDYHEMVVHNTARYLETDLKRVVFVGGGDSMLLHNILQYPTLEKVVGLEIDQFVTRSSFFHFGTQPHFDNPKVEWWFGDATKSLLMLPRSYFGSFDLVLVDLSETVASMSVTHHMNVMEALSLLLQPKGIMLKNEYNYFGEQKEVFRDALHIHWYGVPYVCSQSLVMGSNGLDLMRTPYKHIPEVDPVMIYPLLQDPNIHMGYLHDYQKNYTNPQRFCIPIEVHSSQEKQEKSPGIMMVMEAEDATVSLLKSMSKLQKAVEKALKKSGLHVTTSYLPSTVDPNLMITVMKEGYVVSRAFPDASYCAFDLQLWGSYEKQEPTKKALIEAVGSQVKGRSSSSYRIVSGGMFGISTWKDDENQRGPELESCDEPSAAEVDTVAYQSLSDASNDLVIASVLESQALVLDSTSFTVLVLCGLDDSKCPMAGKIKEADHVANVIVLKPCESIGNDGVEFLQDALSRMTSCEIETYQALSKAISVGKIRSIVLDPSAPRSLAQIVVKIAENSINQRRFFASEMTVNAPVLDLSETWRSQFVDRFRTDIFEMDPSFRADLFFNNTQDKTSLMTSVFGSGDNLFGQHLVEYVERLEGRFENLQGEIRMIRGNLFENFLTQDPIITDQNFTDADFDQQATFENWISQKPMGLQILFQFEMAEQGRRSKSMFPKSHLKAAFKTSLEQFVESKIEVESFNDLGEGQLVVAVWAEGSAILLFDGRDHADVNLFLYKENFGNAKAFEEAYVGSVPGMSRTLRDTFPRGTGRVISFMKDLGGFDDSGRPIKTPRWAPEGEKKAVDK